MHIAGIIITPRRAIYLAVILIGIVVIISTLQQHSVHLAEQKKLADELSCKSRHSVLVRWIKC